MNQVNDQQNTLVQEATALMDAITHNPELRDDIRQLLKAHECKSTVEQRMNDYARKKGLRLLLLACLNGVPGQALTAAVSRSDWVQHIISSQEQKQSAENHTLLGNAFENFSGALRLLSIDQETIRHALAQEGVPTSKPTLDTLSVHARGLLADLQEYARPRPKDEPESSGGGHLYQAYKAHPTMRRSVTFTYDQASSLACMIQEVLGFLGITSDQIRESLNELPPRDIAARLDAQE